MSTSHRVSLNYIASFFSAPTPTSLSNDCLFILQAFPCPQQVILWHVRKKSEAQIRRKKHPNSPEFSKAEVCSPTPGFLNRRGNSVLATALGTSLASTTAAPCRCFTGKQGWSWYVVSLEAPPVKKCSVGETLYTLDVYTIHLLPGRNILCVCTEAVHPEERHRCRMLFSSPLLVLQLLPHLLPWASRLFTFQRQLPVLYSLH